MDLSALRLAMKARNVRSLYAKQLAPNDNSKNQPYFGSDFSVLNILPSATPVADMHGSRPNFKARLRFSWLTEDGRLSPAPNAQLILYPDYPEVRFSGYLRGSEEAPSALMGTTREPGRLLFVGVTADRQTVGYAVGPEHPLNAEFRALHALPTFGVFSLVPLDADSTALDDRSQLLAELSRIHHLGWIQSKRLKGGAIVTCEASQCGGYTLEAELGISSNGISLPDFRGWEVKAHGVTNFEKLSSGPITLMTPEPRGGYYKTDGAVAFIDRYGYQSDKPERIGRRDFSGRHQAWQSCERTGLTLTLIGYDREKSAITDTTGAVALVDAKDRIAASWPFTELVSHWMRKHASAAYVPFMKQSSPRLNYKYASSVRLGVGTDFNLFLAAVNAGSLYYDPGIHYRSQSGKTTTKKRSQFRMASRSLPLLYHSMETVETGR